MTKSEGLGMADPTVGRQCYGAYPIAVLTEKAMVFA